MGIKVVFRSNKEIYGLNNEQEEKIKEDLTIDNPAYTQAKKYSKYNNVYLPKYLYYYKQESRYLTVPSGYTVPFDISLVEDLRIENTVDYPSFSLELRDTQIQAEKAYLDDTDKGMIILPTGKGKSILGLHLAFLLRQKTLIIVHKDDLASGWKADAELCFESKLKTGLLKAKKKIVGEQITIAMIQTLNRMSKDELKNLYSQFGLVICDELHHAPSASYDLVANFNSAYKLGLTATPERSDGLTKVMNFHFGEIAFRYEATKEDKDILNVKVIIRDSEVSYIPEIVINKVNIPVTQLPYTQRPRINYHEIDTKVVLDEKYMLQVCSDISKEYIKGRSIVVFFNQKEHLREYSKYMIENGLPEEHIQMYYGDAKESKDEMKRKAESKEVYITLATYSIATEGTNVKAWEVCFLVSSINNEKNTEQALGRIRRSKEGKINPVLVYDYSHPKVYTVNNHIGTRMKRYNKLDFEIDIKKPKGLLFSRGRRL